MRSTSNSSVNSFYFLRRQIYFLLAAVHFSYLQVKCSNFLWSSLTCVHFNPWLAINICWCQNASNAHKSVELFSACCRFFTRLSALECMPLLFQTEKTHQLIIDGAWYRRITPEWRPASLFWFNYFSLALPSCFMCAGYIDLCFGLMYNPKVVSIEINGEGL